MDKLGSKKDGKVIHKLHAPSTAFNTDLARCNKVLFFMWLGTFSTEYSETITTSF